jgi:hypothetical protein
MREIFVFGLTTICTSMPTGKGGKNRRRGKNMNLEKRELTFKEDGQGNNSVGAKIVLNFFFWFFLLSTLILIIIRLILFNYFISLFFISLNFSKNWIIFKFQSIFVYLFRCLFLPRFLCEHFFRASYWQSMIISNINLNSFSKLNCVNNCKIGFILFDI